MPDVVYHGWTHRPKALGGTDPIEFPAGGPAPWCRLTMETDQTIPTHPAAPVINFTQSVNEYPGTFDVVAGSGGELYVDLLEEGIYHLVVYVHVDSMPTNGFQIGIVGGVDMSDDWNHYIDPRSQAYVFSELTLRNGPDFDYEMYAYIRTISGNAAFDVDSAATFLEVHKLADTTHPV